MTAHTEPTITRIWWLYIPAGFFVLQLLAEIFMPRDLLESFHNENGAHELLEAFIMTISFAMATTTAVVAYRVRRPWICAWAALAAVCSLYVCGEEISWGQHFFNWETPESWAAINDQNETNFHNISEWLDQKPKLLLQIGAYVGGLIVPLLLAKKPGFMPARFNFIYPSKIMGVTAAFGLGVMIQHKIAQVYAPFIFFTRANEVQELYLYYFVVLYMYLLYRRLQSNFLKR